MNIKCGIISLVFVLVIGCSSTASNKSNEISGPAYTGTGEKV
jgi:hypothetical protein